MAFHEGEWQPLFHTSMEGAFSPSPSLRVERHHVQPGSWYGVVIPKQVITLALSTHEIRHSVVDGDSYLAVDHEGAVRIHTREHKHSFYWCSHATTLNVELDDAVLDGAESSESEYGPDEHQEQTLSPLLYALEAERLHGYPNGRLFVDGIEQAIACIVVAMTRGSRRERTRCHVPSLAPYQMRRVHDYVQAHLDEKIILHDLAREAGLSASHFSRLFRKRTGTTPHKYVLDQRIEHAKHLLTDARQSLLDVALASGFRTHQHFSRVFHQVTGHSPRRYRALL